MLLFSLADSAISANDNRTSTGHTEKTLFIDIEAALKSNDLAQASQLRQEFADSFYKGASDEAKLKYHSFGCRILSDNILYYSMEPDSELISSLKQEYSKLEEYYIKRDVSNLDKSDKERLKEISEFQSITVGFGDVLVKGQLFTESIDMFQKAKLLFDSSKDVLEEGILTHITRHTADGVTTEETTTPIWERYSMYHPESIQRNIINAAILYDRHANTTETNRLLKNCLEKYTSEFPSYPYAGVYTSMKMKLDDNFDLDQLVAAFEKCEDKNHTQYIYSTLGLSNRLIEFGRSKEALKYLKHIEENGISQQRQDELLYGLGRAYYMEGDYKTALKYLVATKAVLKHNYDPDHYIEQIFAASGTESIARETIENLLDIEPKVSNDISKSVKKMEHTILDSEEETTSKQNHTIEASPIKVLSQESPNKNLSKILLYVLVIVGFISIGYVIAFRYPAKKRNKG